MVASWRDLGRVLRDQAFNAVDCRPLLNRLAGRRSRTDVAKSMRSIFEALETRQLLTTIQGPSLAPTPTSTIQTNISGPSYVSSTDDANSILRTSHSTPSIAYDPTNPNKLVSAYVEQNRDNNGRLVPSVVVSYSTNGGATWTSLGSLGKLLSPGATTQTSPRLYADATDPTVAFDRRGQFYVLVSQHDADYGSGALALTKYDFTTTVPLVDAFVDNRVVYYWASGRDEAYAPTLAINTNVQTFVDPTNPSPAPEEILADPTFRDPVNADQGPIYIAWATDDVTNPNLTNRNPQVIKLAGSHDGGVSFSPPVVVNDGGHGGNDRHSAPRLVVSQGSLRVDPFTGELVVPAGQLTIVWDNTPVGGATTDQLLADKVKDGVVAVNAEIIGESPTAVFPTPFPITEGTGGATPTPGLTDVPFDLTVPAGFELSKLTVQLAIQHPALGSLTAKLVAPNGTEVTLFRTRNANGTTGITGTTLGIIPQKAAGAGLVPTVFDDQSDVDINDGPANFIGTYNPDGGSLEDFAGMFDTDIMSGQWHLVLEDNNTSAASDTVTREIVFFQVNLLQGLTTDSDATVAGGLTVRGDLQADFPKNIAASPDRGVGPGASLASDNTLGVFSPYAGRLYVAYTDRLNTTRNEADNTDVFLRYSDDGGSTWLPYQRSYTADTGETFTVSGAPVNDDWGRADGFSASDTFLSYRRGRSQFQPTIAVDPTSGALVMTWYDARHDAANARVARYVATSVDGGQSFGEQTFLNRPNEVFDAISGKPVILGPIPDNMSAGLPNYRQEGMFAFGERQGLVVINGRVHAVWTGNENGGYSGRHLYDIYTANTTIGAGPRIVASTMGVVSRPADLVNLAVNNIPGLEYIDVTFDRPIDPSTFDPSAVHVFFRPAGTSGTTAGVPIAIDPDPSRAVTAMDLQYFGNALAPAATKFRIKLETRQTAAGTYTYSIDPVVNDGIRYYGLGNYSAPVTFSADADPTQVNLPVPGPGSNVGFSKIAVSGLDPADVLADLNVYVELEGHGAIDDYGRAVSLFLMDPLGNFIPLALQRYSVNNTNTQAILTPGLAGHGYQSTWFDDRAATPVRMGTFQFSGTFRPEQLGDDQQSNLDQFGYPHGSLAAFNGLAGADANGDWILYVIDPRANDGVRPVGNLRNWRIELRTATVISDTSTTPYMGNVLDQDGDGLSGQVALPNRTIGDVYAVPAPADAFGYANGLFLAPPFDAKTQPIIVPGPTVLDTVEYASAPGVAIPDAVGTTPGVLSDTITIAGDARARVRDLFVKVRIDHDNVNDLVLVLYAPDNTPVTLVNRTSRTTPGGAHFGVNVGGGQFPTFLMDSATTSVQDDAAEAPYYGYFRPATPLSVLKGKTLNGNWRLEVRDMSENNAGTLVSWSVVASADLVAVDQPMPSIPVLFDRPIQVASFTAGRVLRIVGPSGIIPLVDASNNPLVSVAPDPADPDYLLDPTTARRFVITFAQALQDVHVRLGGNYTVTLSPDIVSVAGDKMDANLNAGLDALRNESPATEYVVYASAGLPVTLPDPLRTDGVAVSTIDIPDTEDFVLKNLKVHLNITYPRAAELTGLLVAPDGTTVTLFDHLRTGGTLANFTNTIFDDRAAVPVQQGVAPYNGTYNPLQPLLHSLLNKRAAGTWTLVIRTNGVHAGTINDWALTLEKPMLATGLGEVSADESTVPFRVFGMAPTDPLAHQAWTPVTSTQQATGQTAGRVSALAVDPADTSGNTVYAAGASGGVWRTTNFLTTDQRGPTWVPLTDFGPARSLNIGSVAVFAGRDAAGNLDASKSVIVAGTGEAASNTPGVGFIVSRDGGNTWTLYDSAVNVDVATGTPLAMTDPLRNHVFAGAVVHKVVVDPNPTSNGEVVIYAAVATTNNAANGGSKGGVWRSMDSGKTWQRMLAGNATDVLLDANSGTYNAATNPTRNLQVVFAAIRGDGVYRSPNRGQVWNQMLGGIGVPLIRDGNVNTNPPIDVDELDASPNGNKGRIILAQPALTGDPVQDVLYQGWLYAAVATTAPNGAGGFGPTGSLDGLYLTKDFGQNWTKVDVRSHHLSTDTSALPSNDPAHPVWDVTAGNGMPDGQANYDLVLAVDPNNPNVVYLGGSHYARHDAGFIRVDTTGISDAHSFYMGNSAADGGAMTIDTTNVATMFDAPGRWGGFANPIQQGTLNLLQDHGQPFVSATTVYVSNARELANNGGSIKWIPFDEFLRIPGREAEAVGSQYATDYHRLVTVRDPLTGQSRLILGTEQGIYTVVDDGTGRIRLATSLSEAPVGSRNGNIQVGQYYFGAVQPSQLAADIVGALFYATSQGDGTVTVPSTVLTTGDITGNSSGPGVGGGVAVDPTGSGASYDYAHPFYSAVGSDFFRVNGVARVFGLLQTGTGGNTSHDPQWPDFPFAATSPWTTWGANFDVNRINRDQIIISSYDGRIFATENQGRFWSVIGEPANPTITGGGTGQQTVTYRTLDGTYARALAYGAPDPAGPSGPSVTNHLIYVGTTGGTKAYNTGGGTGGTTTVNVPGHIFVTFNGGGANGNDWVNLSAGLDGSAVMAIVTNPTPGSHEAYAVTERGVYYMADSTSRDPVTGAYNGVWVRVTGNIFTVPINPFGDANLAVARATELTSIVADWRYAIPDNFNDPAAGTHPVLYVGGDGGSVFRSLDNGATWTLFPEPDDASADNATAAGGYLPSVTVSDLDVAFGNVDPLTGMPDPTGNDSPSILLATTYGRGSFAVRLAPVIMNLHFGSGAGGMTVDGHTLRSAFGNTTTVNFYNVSDPSNPVLVGTTQADADGNFTFAVPAGLRAVGVQATDTSTVVGAMNVIALPPAAPGRPRLLSDSGTTGDDMTNARRPVIDDGGVTVDPNATVDIYVNGTRVMTVIANGTGNWTATLPFDLADGNYAVTATQTDALGSVSPQSLPLDLVIDGTAPAGTARSSLSGTAGQTLSGTLARFSDAHTVVSATIDWGDGQITSGVLTLVSGQWDVSGSHAYATAGNYVIKVYATDNAGNTNAAAVQTTASVTAPAFTFRLIGQARSVDEGSPFNGRVAIVDDANLAHTSGSLTATINWGDGTVTAGTVVAGSDPSLGRFDVLGTHTYLDNRSDRPAYDVIVTVRATDGAAATTGSLVTATNVGPTPTITGPASVFVGQTATFTLTATDPSVTDRAAGFTYVIDWGDGTSTTVNPTANNGSGVTVTHAFATIPTRAIAVSARDKDGTLRNGAPLPVNVSALPQLNGSAVNAGTTQRSDIDFISFGVANTDLIGGISLSDLALYYNGGQQVSLVGAGFTFDPSSGAGTLDLRSLNLADGDYQLQIAAGSQVLTVPFFKLTADLNGDGLVNAKDEAIVKASVNKTSGQPGFNAAADLNGDGVVNAADALIAKAYKNRKISAGAKVLQLQTGKAAKKPTLNLGTVRVGSSTSVDLVIRNTNKNGVMLSLDGLNVAGNANLAFAVVGQAWGTSPGKLTLAPGQQVVVRVYLKAATQQQAVGGGLGLFFSTISGKDYRDVVVPIKGVIKA